MYKVGMNHWRLVIQCKNAAKHVTEYGAHYIFSAYTAKVSEAMVVKTLITTVCVLNKWVIESFQQTSPLTRMDTHLMQLWQDFQFSQQLNVVDSHKPTKVDTPLIKSIVLFQWESG